VIALSACGAPKATKGSPCEQVGDHVYAMLERTTPPNGKHDVAHEKAIRDIFATKCKADAWDVEARTCILNKKAINDEARCKDKLNATQRQALDTALGEEEDRARLARLPRACTEYRDRVDKLQTCRTVKQETKDAMKQAFTQLIAGGAKGAALEEACKRSLESTKRAYSAQCGW
jgi:hypothetical protein